MKNQSINTQIIRDFMKTNKLSKTAFCHFCSIGYSSLKNILEDNVLYVGLDKNIKIARAIKTHPTNLCVK